MKFFLKKLSNKISKALLLIAAVVSFTSSFAEFSYAGSGTNFGVGRTRSCDSSGSPDGLDFDFSTGGQDAEFVMTNPVCQAIFLRVYVSVKLAIAAMNKTCGTGSAIPRVRPSPFLDSIDLGKAGYKAATSTNKTCAGLWGTAVFSYASAILELSTIYKIAENTYDNTEVCGASWLKPNIADFNNSTPDYKKSVQDTVEGYFRDKTKSEENGTPFNDGLLDLEDFTYGKKYREWHYGGVEVIDNPNGNASSCKDVVRGKISGSYPAQRYYLQGLEAGNFNCKRYSLASGQRDPATGEIVTEETLADFEKAYACCKDRSKKYICLKYKGANTFDSMNFGTDRSVFCKAGKLCTIQGITFFPKSVEKGRLLCAETYSLCPYNFSIGGGSEYCDYFKDGVYKNGRWELITPEDIATGDCTNKSEIRNSDCTFNEKTNKCRNYCQYLTHCARTSHADYNYSSGLVSPYFSNACLNFIGDSQNQMSFSNGGFIPSSQRHFSAPIAQCVKETLENLFYNKVGHSECYNEHEFPTEDGVCPSGQYKGDGTFEFKLGNEVGGKSFFSTIQEAMHDIVTIVLVLSVTFYGMNILLGKVTLSNKKDFLVYLVKIGLVLFFSIGGAWQAFFFKGVYGSATEFSRMVFKINTGTDERKLDGCQFGALSKADGTVVAPTQPYPSGKEYLAMWDTLDCKMMRYLGMGPKASAANIASLVIAGWFTMPWGIYLAMSVMFFGFFFVAATIRALHIFLTSYTSILLMVFVSPLIIPTVLFAKTNDIFKNWLKNLISFCLQPMILMAYIAIFITVLDKTMLGSATFYGNSPIKAMSCAKVCVDANKLLVPYLNGIAPACDETGERIINPMNDSVACLINVNDFGKFPGFEIVGIAIPVLTGIFNDNPKEKILTLLKGALVMFLLYKFMDQISGIASSLMGGTALPGSKANAGQMFMKIAGGAKAIQQRATRGSGVAAKAAKEKADKLANKGKDKDDDDEDKDEENKEDGEGSDDAKPKED